MAKKLVVIGAKPKKIKVVDQPKRRLDPADLAAALGANPDGQPTHGISDPLALAEVGAQLLARLRSSGGRPSLIDATVNCRVPLSAEDVRTLEAMVAHIVVSTGARPSVGQMVSIIVHRSLADLTSDSTKRIDTLPVGGVGSILPGWRSLFPNVPDLNEVTARARSVARRKMPLMITYAA